jgi:hypothetical protein
LPEWPSAVRNSSSPLSSITRHRLKNKGKVEEEKETSEEKKKLTAVQYAQQWLTWEEIEGLDVPLSLFFVATAA